MPEPGVIRIAEPVTPIVASPAVLRLAFDGPAFAGVGAKPEVPPTDRHGRLFGLEQTSDLSATVAIRAIDPAVESPIESVDAVLLVAFCKSCEQHLAHICSAVAIGVLRVENVRRGADERPFAPGHHAARVRDIFKERRCLVETPVTVGV